MGKIQSSVRCGIKMDHWDPLNVQSEKLVGRKFEGVDVFCDTNVY